MHQIVRTPCLTATRGRDRGFGLVELMVSMLIGLVIIAALVTLFVNTSGNNRELARANSMIENGRFAIKVLEDDLAHAGYWGAYVPAYDDQNSIAVPAAPPAGDLPTAVPNPCLAYSTANWNATYVTNLIGIPVQAYDDDEAAGLDDCENPGPLDVIEHHLAGTDVLVVRHADLAPVCGSAPCDADDPGNLYMQPGLCLSDTAPYVFGTSGYTVMHQLNCTAQAERRKFVSHIYYVRDHAVTHTDGIPTLVRSEFDLDGTLRHQTPVALVEGIQAFRIEFGVDDLSKTDEPVDYAVAVNWADPLDRATPRNRGDGAPDGPYIRCSPDCALEELMNVTSAKIYILARSREASPSYTDTKTYTLGSAGTVGPFNDNFKRHVFTTTVRMPNIAGRRISP
jgi:type IV pilus assembly protein PilW